MSAFIQGYQQMPSGLYVPNPIGSFIQSDGSTFTASQGGSVESPRDHIGGFRILQLPLGGWIHAFEIDIQGWGVANTQPNQAGRIVVYNHDQYNVPTSPTEIDTGAIEFDVAQLAGGNIVEAAGTTLGRTKLRFELVEPKFARAGKLPVLFEHEYIYTGAGEVAYAAGPGFAVSYPVLGSAGVANGLRRTFGTNKVEGATASLAAWSPPTFNGFGAGATQLTDANNRGEAVVAIGVVFGEGP